jgi:hypothetical protein
MSICDYNNFNMYTLYKDRLSQKNVAVFSSFIYIYTAQQQQAKMVLQKCYQAVLTEDVQNIGCWCPNTTHAFVTLVWEADFSRYVSGKK